MREYNFPEHQFRKYKGQLILMKGDIVKSDVYFTDGKDIRVCELLYRYKPNIWRALDIKGNREIYIETGMIEKVLVDKWWHKRHDNPEKYKYYWEVRVKEEL